MDEAKSTISGAIRAYRTENGPLLHGLSLNEFRSILTELSGPLGLSLNQITEAAAYSFAMVVRYALGLEAKDAEVLVLVNDSLAGCIALATARQLSNSGAKVRIAIERNSSERSPALQRQLTPLQKVNIEIEHLDLCKDQSLHVFGTDVNQALPSYHTILLGFFDPQKSEQQTPGPALATALNDSATPAHSVLAPPGLNVDTGEFSDLAIYSSSTLSLGAPLIGLCLGEELVGRHFLCDISIPPYLYERFNIGAKRLFSDQPITKIFPIKDLSEIPA